MAASPQFKVYDANGRYEGCAKNIETCAAMVALLGNGATIRRYHKTVLWTEGEDGEAGESYDRVVLLAYDRMDKRKAGGPQ